MNPVAGPVMCAVAYLIGGIPIGALVASTRGLDIRKVGSGNIGASNVLRTLGAKAGLIVWVADVLKGALPLWVARALTTDPARSAWWLGIIGLFAVLGHCCSPYLRLGGGRGVSTILGVILALDWRVALIGLALWIAIVAISRYISLGSMVAVLVAALLLAAFDNQPGIWVPTLCASLLVIARHAPNIRRLLSGTETKIGQRARLESPPNG